METPRPDRDRDSLLRGHLIDKDITKLFPGGMDRERRS